MSKAGLCTFWLDYQLVLIKEVKKNEEEGEKAAKRQTVASYLKIFPFRPWNPRNFIKKKKNMKMCDFVMAHHPKSYLIIEHLSNIISIYTK